MTLALADSFDTMEIAMLDGIGVLASRPSALLLSSHHGCSELLWPTRYCQWAAGCRRLVAMKLLGWYSTHGVVAPDAERRSLHASLDLQ